MCRFGTCPAMPCPALRGVCTDKSVGLAKAQQLASEARVKRETDMHRSLYHPAHYGRRTENSKALSALYVSQFTATSPA